MIRVIQTNKKKPIAIVYLNVHWLPFEMLKIEMPGKINKTQY